MTVDSLRASLRRLPSVGRLVESREIAPLIERHGHAAVVRATRGVLDTLRAGIAASAVAAEDLVPDAVHLRIAERLAAAARPYYCRVINATGVVLHTNLGRAPLAASAVEALAAAAGSAQRLEVDLATGERGGRDQGCAALLREVTGAEAATVVNNNAAAMLLVLSATAHGRRVVISRGELVEIGGSFRVPEVMSESGALLAEVGTTNRTHLADYRRALDEPDAPPVGLLLKVHTSNYRIEGFTAEVGVEDLVALGAERGVPVVHDLGSGCLVDLKAYGLPEEPLVRRSVAAGVDVTCFSGDKLLGGPQAGILVGRRETIDRCRRHPLYRALRPGRLVYAALEATLSLYRRGEQEALERVPALARLTASPDALAARAERLAKALAAIPGMTAEHVACASQAGSGSMPARELPSRGVRTARAGWSARELAARLRRGEPPVVARVQEDALVFDVRTLGEPEVDEIAVRVRELAEED